MKGVVQIPQQQQSTEQRGWGEWREKGKALAARKYHREQIIIPDSEASARWYPGLRPAACVQFVHKAPEGSASGEKPFSHLRLWELDSFRRRRHTGAQPSTTPEACSQHFLTRLKILFWVFVSKREAIDTLNHEVDDVSTPSSVTVHPYFISYSFIHFGSVWVD